MYAIVRGGSRQHKVMTGDVLEIDLVDAEIGDAISLPVVLVVDDDKVTSDPEALAKVKATAEVVDVVKGPKIKIIKFKNKSGYKKRQGHRQRYTKVKITGIK